MTEAKVDMGAWWIEDRELHLDIPRLLKNCGLPDTGANRALVVCHILDVAAKELPRSPCVVFEHGAAE